MTNKAEEGAQYIAEKQKEIGLALLILMQETIATECAYSIGLVGEGKKYKVTSFIEEVQTQQQSS
jgi:hypothetical protein